MLHVSHNPEITVRKSRNFGIKNFLQQYLYLNEGPKQSYCNRIKSLFCLFFLNTNISLTQPRTLYTQLYEFIQLTYSF